MLPIGYIAMTKSKPAHAQPPGLMEAPAQLAPVERAVDRAARENALRFGKLIRERREALGMRQDDLALATGVGRRFVIDLEAGKPGCQLGKSLVVATAVGVNPFDIDLANDDALLPELSDLE